MKKSAIYIICFLLPIFFYELTYGQNKDTSDNYIIGQPFPYWRPLRRMFKLITQNDKYIYFPTTCVTLNKDSTYIYFYNNINPYFNEGSFDIEKRHLILKSYIECDSCIYVKIINDGKNIISINFFDNYDPAVIFGGCLCYYKNGIVNYRNCIADFISDSIFFNNSYVPFFKRTKNGKKTNDLFYIQQEIDYDSIIVYYVGFKDVCLKKNKNNESFEVYLLPSYYFSIGTEKWKIRRKRIIDPHGRRFMKMQYLK
jgi:hypothetical protein